MELMDESLTHFLKPSPGDIPYYIEVNIAMDITQALAFLHTNAIIHRDLSSNNVLLIAGSRAKVSDFGMSRLIDINTSRQVTMTTCPGTPNFMSPEALNEPPVYTEKLDNFSLGVLLVQIVTRKYPKPSDRFEIETVRSLFNLAPKVETRILIPKVKRRQAHINLIKPTHPLLPIALECLKDKAEERPSSSHLCQSLEALKTMTKFKDSFQQDIQGTLKVKIAALQDELETKMKEIDSKDEIIRAKVQQLQSKDEVIRMKDDISLANDERLREIQKKMEHQLIRNRETLESNEKLIAMLQHTIAQRDVEIVELKEKLAKKDQGPPCQ